MKRASVAHRRPLDADKHEADVARLEVSLRLAGGRSAAARARRPSYRGGRGGGASAVSRPGREKTRTW